ncbi:putative SUI1 domain-containing protein [Seiridium cardinale]|uniref:SUI1 domain-containing protein n=1 Tax=Seiridium cardinale TaxID=138064 RepID=A0ABR2Y217_9PEZI
MSENSSEYPIVPRNSFDPFSPPRIQIKEYDVRFTAIEGLGLDPSNDISETFRVLKKRLGCGGIIITDPEMGEVILLQGDQRSKVENFLKSGEAGTGFASRFVEFQRAPDLPPFPSPRMRKQKRLKSASSLTEIADIGDDERTL